jgi:hypothetical protein
MVVRTHFQNWDSSSLLREQIFYRVANDTHE